MYILQHNQDRKHRTYVYTLIVTEMLEDWEDSVNIGMFNLTMSYYFVTLLQKARHIPKIWRIPRSQNIFKEIDI